MLIPLNEICSQNLLTEEAIGFQEGEFTRDHLGNNRAVIDRSGTVRQKIDYYPSGTPFSTRAYTITSGFQPFKYNGKEFDMMHGLNTYDYGARQYYPLFAQWDRVDPLCEKYYHVSPYAYYAKNTSQKLNADLTMLGDKLNASFKSIK